ncbi:MAG: GNAT family protein [Ilumatobacter sp.]|uniref:GNAT family N-acetyltransferase n=1 Tax=Ilumatobacter sp. TaxID=1967498 RepID=UPI00263994FF|nr:GNAT family protein [Ilumatobacter sp.]MDJ0768079.1 GNAT family protein [Ilumatobacter sp.]
MPHPFWPLFDVEVRTPRLTLRYVDDDLGVELTQLALGGIHDPDVMPFAMPWTDVPDDELGPNSFRHWWSCRAGTSVERWSINLAVIENDTVVGASGLGAEQFPTTRWFETGSWLGIEHQGRGLGTELRLATLHLGFLGFDALTAGTGAYADNAPSLAVTAKLGYEPNGVEPHERRGERADIHRFRMSRNHFLDRVRREDVEISGDEAARAFLGIAR